MKGMPWDVNTTVWPNYGLAEFVQPQQLVFGYARQGGVKSVTQAHVVVTGDVRNHL